MGIHRSSSVQISMILVVGTGVLDFKSTLIMFIRVLTLPGGLLKPLRQERRILLVTDLVNDLYIEFINFLLRRCRGKKDLTVT